MKAKGFVKIWYKPAIITRPKRRSGMRVRHEATQIHWAIQFGETQFRVCTSKGLAMMKPVGAKEWGAKWAANVENPKKVKWEEFWINVGPRDNCVIAKARQTKGGNLKLDRPSRRKRKVKGKSLTEKLAEVQKQRIAEGECPRCGSKFDEPCKTSGGKVIKKRHDDRPAAAPKPTPTIRTLLGVDLNRTGLKAEITETCVVIPTATGTVLTKLIKAGWVGSTKTRVLTKEVRGFKARVEVRSIEGGTMIRPVNTKKN